MDGLELISFQIISSVGTARSMYIEAIHEAKKGKIEEAKQMIKEGEKYFHEGHKAHAKIIQEEASGNKTELNILLMHAEDQLMSAEAFLIIAEELIDVYERMETKGI